jgi:predicted methyltransferase MtxX (methanogen marker protein 4)
MEKPVIGIGVGAHANRVAASIIAVLPYIEVIAYCKTRVPVLANIPVEICCSDTPEEDLVRDLVSGRICAAVRGTLPFVTSARAIKKGFGVDVIERLALLETPAGHRFFLGPIGVDEGRTPEEKASLILHGRMLAKKFCGTEMTGLISGVRPESVGRDPDADRIFAETKELAKCTGAMHFDARIENAIEDCGVIIAPDGICGNQIYRTLTFPGGGYGYGAPVLNIDRVFVDTSRATRDFSGPLAFAAELAGFEL